jgi:hypothetical protein
MKVAFGTRQILKLLVSTFSWLPSGMGLKEGRKYAKHGAETGAPSREAGVYSGGSIRTLKRPRRSWTSGPENRRRVCPKGDKRRRQAKLPLRLAVRNSSAKLINPTRKDPKQMLKEASEELRCNAEPLPVGLSQSRSRATR